MARAIDQATAYVTLHPVVHSSRVKSGCGGDKWPRSGASRQSNGQTERPAYLFWHAMTVFFALRENRNKKKMAIFFGAPLNRPGYTTALNALSMRPAVQSHG
jgi:hypothetical protein